MELVIMAAGMGSRYGGLKQLDPVDDNGNFIIDYSIYDAIRCGFDKVVFIIKEENYDLFRETVGRRVEKHIETVYVFQNNNNVPSEYKIPETRKSPLGTGHAILCTKPVVSSNFAVINADDFYGYEAFKAAADFLKNNQEEDQYALIGYQAKNTFCGARSVKRGVCESHNGLLTKITESSLEIKDENTIIATPLEKENGGAFEIEPNTIVSMNLFAFTPKFLKYLDSYFAEFLNAHKDSLDKAEFFLPSVVTQLVREGKSSVVVHETDAVWYGMTYKEDKELVCQSILNDVKNGKYPSNLWN